MLQLSVFPKTKICLRSRLQNIDVVTRRRRPSSVSPASADPNRIKAGGSGVSDRETLSKAAPNAGKFPPVKTRKSEICRGIIRRKEEGIQIQFNVGSELPATSNVKVSEPVEAVTPSVLIVPKS